MTRRFLHAATSTFVGLGLLGLGLISSAADDETPTIKEAMQKLHKGAKAPLATLKKALNEDKPEWKTIQDNTKLFAALAPSLAKNDPPKGEKASWKTLAESFEDASDKMNDAAKKEDLKATKDAYKTVSGSCMACHKAHKK